MNMPSLDQTRFGYYENRSGRGQMCKIFAQNRPKLQKNSIKPLTRGMASDARSILGVKDVGGSSKPLNPLEEAMGGKIAPKAAGSSKPPLGVSREVFNLLQQQQPDDAVSTGDLSR